MNYVITGRVIRGDGYGRKIGFPTVNLETKDVLPPTGVYSGVASLDEKDYRAGIIIRPRGKVDPVRSRPLEHESVTVTSGRPASNGIEAHLIGYNGDTYGKTVVLEVKKFLREYKKFDTEEELIAQIKLDLQECT